MDQIQTTVRVFAWWWSDSQVASNFDSETPPKKETYVEIKDWNAGGLKEFPHPDKIDIVCSIRNNMPTDMRLRLVAYVDFKVASYDEIRTISIKKGATEADLDAKFDSIPWTERRLVGEAQGVTTKIGELREFNFADFALRPIIDRYLKSNADSWPWKMRLVVHVFDENGKELSSTIKILDLIPGD